MKAEVTYFRTQYFDEVFSNEEDRLAYTQVDGLVYLPRYPKIIDLPVWAVGGVVEATYMSIDEFVSAPPFVKKYVWSTLKTILMNIDVMFYWDEFPTYRPVYSRFENHIVVAKIFIPNPYYIY